MPPAAAKSKYCMPGKFRPVLFSPSDLVWQNLLSPIFVSLKFKFAEDKNKMGAKYSLKTIYSCELPIPKNDFNFYRQRFEIFGMFLARQLTSPWATNNPCSPPPPPRGNFRGYDFLKAYGKCYKISHVCSLAVGAFRIFGVKRENLCKKSLKIGNNF